MYGSAFLALFVERCKADVRFYCKIIYSATPLLQEHFTKNTNANCVSFFFRTGQSVFYGTSEKRERVRYIFYTMWRVTFAKI